MNLLMEWIVERDPDIPMPFGDKDRQSYWSNTICAGNILESLLVWLTLHERDEIEGGLELLS